MTQVLLINPPIYYEKNQPKVLDVSFPSLGLLYLAAFLEKKQISVKVVDTGADKKSLSETLSFISNENPIVIGITSMTPTLQGAVTLAKTIKKKFKNISIALGGSHVSADPMFIHRHQYFDFAICGEGETAFYESVIKIIKGKKVIGIITGKPLNDLSIIPKPARHLINPNHYLKKASLIATRGCPYNCYYCSRPAVSNKVRCRPVKDIVDEMEELFDISDGEYLFQDDALTINNRHTELLCEEIISRNIPFRWAAYTRVDLVNEKLLRLMSKAGCYSLTFGIESGDERLRNEIIGKKFSNQKIVDTVKTCRQLGINPDGFFMFSHPTETKEQIEKTIKFILNTPFNIIGVSIATPFPGSSLWNYALKEKQINLKYIDEFALGKKGHGYAGIYPVYVPKNLDLDWLYQQRKKIMRLFYLRPSYIINRVITDITSPNKLKQDLIEGLNVLIKGSSARAPYKKK